MNRALGLYVAVMVTIAAAASVTLLAAVVYCVVR